MWTQRCPHKSLSTGLVSSGRKVGCFSFPLRYPRLDPPLMSTAKCGPASADFTFYFAAQPPSDIHEKPQDAHEKPQDAYRTHTCIPVPVS